MHDMLRQSVLIIEPNTSRRQILSLMVRAARPVEVAAVSSYSAALPVLKAGTPQLVICPWHAGGEDLVRTSRHHTRPDRGVQQGRARPFDPIRAAEPQRPAQSDPASVGRTDDAGTAFVPVERRASKRLVDPARTERAARSLGLAV